MAQPAPAPMIAPTQTITINNQTPSQASVTINVGEEVEIHNEDNVPYEVPISYLTGSTNDNYPLAIYLPAGAKLYLIGTEAATCYYNIDTALSSAGERKRGLGNGPYSIGVDSGTPGGGKK